MVQFSWRALPFRAILLACLCCAGSVAYGQDMTVQGEVESSITEILNFYRQPGIMTRPGQYTHLLENVPDGVADLCKTVQGLMLHVFWAQEYGVTLSEDRKKEVNLRTFEQMLARIAELDTQAIDVARVPEKRVVGNCRDFSVFLCALLKYKGIPARARCGFGTYFAPDRYMDHWICEYWDDTQERWVRVDAQLDSVQLSYLKPDFEPHDVPSGRFLSGAEAWRLCRRGELDPDLCGIFDMKGLWFVQGDLVRDFMSLNNVEVLPWDCNEIMGGPEAVVSEEDYLLLDRIAELATSGDSAFGEIRSLYESNERLRMPADYQP
jgi:hypothetical protein